MISTASTSCGAALNVQGPVSVILCGPFQQGFGRCAVVSQYRSSLHKRACDFIVAVCLTLSTPYHTSPYPLPFYAPHPLVQCLPPSNVTVLDASASNGSGALDITWAQKKDLGASPIVASGPTLTLGVGRNVSSASDVRGGVSYTLLVAVRDAAGRSDSMGLQHF